MLNHPTLGASGPLGLPDWSNRLVLSTVPGVIGPRDLLLLISQAQDIAWAPSCFFKPLNFIPIIKYLVVSSNCK